MGLSADQLEELKKAFAAIDANGDGLTDSAVSSA